MRLWPPSVAVAVVRPRVGHWAGSLAAVMARLLPFEQQVAAVQHIGGEAVKKLLLLSLLPPPLVRLRLRSRSLVLLTFQGTQPRCCQSAFYHHARHPLELQGSTR